MYYRFPRITPRKYDVINEEVTSEENNSSITTERFAATHAFTLLPRHVRLSLTFRKIRHSPCHCKYPENCDSQNYGQQLVKDKSGLITSDYSRHNSLPQSEEDAMNLEKEHVHNVYESIAEHFSGTRHSPWPKIAEFLKDQPASSIVADVGCGNGKYLGINDQLMMFGSDRSHNLAIICSERGYHVIVCDILSLPYRYSNSDVQFVTNILQLTQTLYYTFIYSILLLLYFLHVPLRAFQHTITIYTI